MPTPPPVTHWLHSRTLRVNALLILLFIFTQLPNMPHVPPDLLPWLTMAVGLLNMLLRLDTNSAIAGTPAAARSATTINIQSGGVQTGDGTAAGVVVGGDVDHLDNLPTPWVDAMTAARAKAQEPPDGA